MTPPSTDRDLWISWDQYHAAIESLAAMVHASGWTFDHIVCLARGGLRPGDVLSRIFRVPLAILAASSYREAEGTVRGNLDIAAHLTTTASGLAGRVLLVDDLVDSGITLEKVQRHLAERFPRIAEIRSAVIWYKGCSCVRPDFFVDYLPTDPWIHQPFERYDTMLPTEVAAKRA
ncbi:MAG: phosphoribosyltransferase [Burkholderiaceae bacterium]